ncbi:MAG: hypothetical protein HY960_07440 [Ignavibacteriae bacterium]|nr:hypothetical protein [Ignavibacteriota bacterium]
MELTIINRKDTKISDEDDAALLTTGFCFATHVHFAAVGATFISLYRDFPTLPENLKRGLIKTIVPGKNTSITEERIDEVYTRLKALRKQRGKIIEEIKLIRASEKFIKSMEEHVQQTFENFLTHFHLMNIVKFTNDDESNIIQTWTLNGYNPDSDHPDYYLHCVATTLYHLEELPFFPSVMETVACKFTASNQDGLPLQHQDEIVFLSEPLFFLPLVGKLEESQILIFRNDFFAEMITWHDLVLAKAKELSTVEFTSEQIPYLNKTLHQFQQVCESIQTLIDAHPFIHLLKSKEGEVKQYCVHLGITSFRNLLSIYRLLGIINEQETLYILEETEQHVNLQNCGLFLYLQSYES